MADVTLTEWKSLLYPKLPGVTDALVKIELRSVLRDFCAKTRIWKEAITPITVAAADARHALAVSRVDVEVVQPEELYYDGKQIHPKSPDELTGMFGQLNWAGLAGRVEWFYMDEATDEIVLVRIPEAAGLVLTGRVSLMPSISTDIYPDFFLKKYGECIADGVIGRMRALPGMPWTETNSAKEHTDAYLEARGGVKVAAWRGNTRSRPRVRGRYL